MTKRVIKEENITKSNNNNNSHYFSFFGRLSVNIIIFILLLSFGMFLLYSSLTINSERLINYKESSDLDYKVYLLPNSFYEEKYLGKNMLYVASLIDKIEIDFDYEFSADAKMNMDFTYSIVADLIITNKTGTRSFYEKKYTLLEDQYLNMVDNNKQSIKEVIDIDYSHYNTIANNFKTLYKVETDSKLNVYMVIKESNPQGGSYTLNKDNRINIIIPLSEKAVDIQMQYSELNSADSVLQKSEAFVSDYLLFILGIIITLFAIVLLVKIIKKLFLLRTKKSAYDRFVHKTLKEYDRLIAESTTLIPFDGKNIIQVEKFTELLDIHDNLQLPIIYYTIIKHQKCYFYISHDDTIYLFVLKATDFEVSKDEKEKQ